MENFMSQKTAARKYRREMVCFTLYALFSRNVKSVSRDAVLYDIKIHDILFLHFPGNVAYELFESLDAQ